MLQPEDLRKDEPLKWSHGRGTDVWAMFQAAMAGDVAAIERLLERDPGLVRSHYEYCKALYFAVRENQVAVARLLLDRGADQVDESFIQTAHERGYREMAELLQANRAARGISAEGNAIASAIIERNLPKVRAMLDASPALLHAGEQRGNRPIHLAVMTRQLDMIDDLIARGADIDLQRFDGARPIQLANGDYFLRGWRDVPESVETRPRNVIDHLRARGAYCDICTACYIGDLDRVRELLAEDPTLANRPSPYITYYACSGTPLRNAAGGGHMEIVKLLLDHGADPNLPEEHIAPRGHALHAAVCNGHIEIVRLLLERGAYPCVPIESSGDTLGAARGNQAMIDLLLSYGAIREPELLGYDGEVELAKAAFAANPTLANHTAMLCSAAGNGHEEFVRLMLHYQPDLPKRVSCGAKTRAIAELLFAHGMDPNRRNWLGVTQLHRFAAKGEMRNAAMFIEHGADLNVRDDDLSSTPLAWAAKSGRIAMVEFLLKQGAKTRLPDDPPWATPLAWATRRGHTEIVELLERFEKDGTLPIHTIEPYERLAADLVRVYDAGDAALLDGLLEQLKIKQKISVEDFRGAARARLGKEPDSSNLSLDEAQRLVALFYGFETWTELLRGSPVP